MAAFVLSVFALVAAWGWFTAPEVPQLRAYETNPYLVVGLPALAAAGAWVAYFLARRRSR
jgi:hypothetical protein